MESGDCWFFFLLGLGWSDVLAYWPFSIGLASDSFFFWNGSLVRGRERVIWTAESKTKSSSFRLALFC